MDLVLVNDVALPTPSSYYDDVEFLENSTRNANATLIRELKSFSCKFWDHTSEGYKTITCYAGKLSGTPIRADNEGGIKDWQDVSINFIEY